MIRFLKRVLCVALCLAVAFVAVRFGPALYERIFGAGASRWVSEKLSETLREKNELVVYEIEVTGQETVTQDAWLLGTVQKVEMPYTFQMSFIVDLSRASVSANGSVVEVRVPSPSPAYPKLIVDESSVRKTDWLYPLTPERYSQIKLKTEERLFDEYGSNADYRANAWDVTVRNLEELFASVAQQSALGSACRVSVIQTDDLPAGTQEESLQSAA